MPKKAPNTLRMDPTRTGMIRRRFEQTVVHLFENLKKKIRRVVVDEDAFGLAKPYTMRLRGMPNLVINEGPKYGAVMLEVSDPWVKSQIEKVQQSIDPADLLKLDDWPHVTVRYGFHDGNSDTLKTLLSQERFAWVKLGRVSLFSNEKEDVLKIDVDGNQLHSMNRLLGLVPNVKTHSEYHLHLTIAYLKPGTGHKYLHRFAAEILTGTELMLHRVIVADSQRNKEEVLLNSRWEFKTTQQQIDEFMNWLATQLTTEILAIQFNDIENTYFGEFIRQSYEKGVGRVFDELKGQPILTEGSVRSFYNGTKEEFLRSTFAQPVSIDRVKALVSRTFTELKNVTSAMGAEMSRTLADGLAQGKSPYDVGRDLSRAIDGIGKKRATMIARTECLPGDTLVDSAVVRAVFRRWYEGDMVEIETRNGRKFSATPNHPMLTQDGWISAGLLNQTHKLIGNTGKENSSSPRNKDIERGPTTLREIFDSLQAVGVSERVPCSENDFHGDGRVESQVDTLRPNRELRIGNFSSLSQPLAQQVFSESGFSASAFCLQCGRLISVNKQSCFCGCSQSYSGNLQSVSDQVTINSEFARQGLQTLPSQISVGQTTRLNILPELVANSPSRPTVELSFGVGSSNTCESDNFSDLLLVRPDPSGNLPLSEAGQIELDDVISVRLVPFVGHVYNLETPFGYYTINQLYTGNTIRAHAEGQLDSMERLGVEEVGVMVEWSVARDSRLCPRCAALAGIVLTLKEARGLLPAHPNCVVGETVIDAPGSVTIMRAKYTGEIVEVVTSESRSVSFTSHHILLTQRGWVFAKDLTDSDYLVNATFANGFTKSPNNDLTHPNIREVFTSLMEKVDPRWIMKSLPMPVYLHGDGKFIDSEIEIIDIDGILRSQCKCGSCGPQIKELLFSLGYVCPTDSLSLKCESFLSFCRNRLANTTDSLMRSKGITDVLLSRTSTHHKTVSGENVPRGETHTNKSFINSPPG